MDALPSGPQGTRRGTVRRRPPLHTLRGRRRYRAAFESVIRDPADFVPYATDRIWAEGLLYAPDHAYERITGEKWDRNTRYSYESYSNTAGWAD